MAYRKLGRRSDQRKAILRNLTTGLYWSPNGYQAAFTSNPVNLIEDTPTRFVWETDALPLEDGRHYVGIRAFDRANNFNLEDDSVIVGETQPPIPNLDSPVPGSRVSSSVVFTGTAIDNREIAEVRLVVRNVETGLYWNGLTCTVIPRWSRRM